MLADGDELKAPAGKAVGRNPVDRSTEKSDEGVIPQNPLKAAAEAREGRPKTKGNSIQSTVSGALDPQETSSGLSRIRAAAIKNGEQRFTSLMHHITPDLLMEAYEALKRNAAPGVDGVSWQTYGEGGEGDLRAKIIELHQRVQDDGYRAQPSKRAWIPKADACVRWASRHWKIKSSNWPRCGS